MHWLYLTEHWRDVAIYLSAAPAGINWRSLAPVLVSSAIAAALSVIVSLAVNQERDNGLERRIARVEYEIEPGMLKVTKTELEGLKTRVTQIEHRHDEIMQMLIRTGSGYTYYPDAATKK